MERRAFVQLMGAATAGIWLGPTCGAAADASAAPGAAAAAKAGAADGELKALFETFLDEVLTGQPEAATTTGLDAGRRAALRSALSDYSSAGRVQWVANCRSQRDRLRRIDPRLLSADARTHRDVVLWQLEHSVMGGERYRFGEGPGGYNYAPYSPYVFSPLSGPYSEIPDFLESQHPVRSAEDAEAYLARLTAFAMAIDASTAALQADAAHGVLAPDFAMDTAIRELQRLRTPLAADNGLVTSLTQRAAAAGIAGRSRADHAQGGWQERARDLVATRVYPALDRQLAAATLLRGRATHEAGVWKLPDGDAYYADALAYQTTTRRAAREVHQYGLQQVAEIQARLDALLRVQGLSTGTVAARLEALSRRRDQLFPNDDTGRAALLAALNAQVAAIRPKLAQAFRTLPAAPVEIVRVPPDIQEGAPLGYAQPASLDGTRVGRYYINLTDTANWPKFSLPTLTFHEAIPGHQWQYALSLESKSTPVLRRVIGSFTAYVEGWALYAEQLAEELGAYQDDPLGQIGYWQSMLFRAVRLVVDTGLHWKRWSRERATEYFIDVTAIPRGRSQGEIDRYCVWPGQACGYKIGQAEWLRLRAMTKAREGSRFDLKAFHEVLRKEAMPLEVLERVVRDQSGFA